jgi:hypothetical protein
MPLFRLQDGTELLPLERLLQNEEDYATTVSELVWQHPEAFMGYEVLPIALNPDIGTDEPPGALFLDASAHVVVVEFAREGDRGLLAGYIDHMAWAANAKIEEVVGLYHSGEEGFRTSWRSFSGQEPPERTERPPILALVAADIYGRDIASFNFLLETSVVLRMVRSALFKDPAGGYILGIERDDAAGI